MEQPDIDTVHNARSYYRQVPEDPRPTLENPKDVKNCRKCSAEFGIFRHKYNCNGCGKIFCKIHCDLFLQLPDSFNYQPDTPVRVCEDCFKKYNLLDFTKNYEEYGNPEAPAVVYLTGACVSRVIPPIVYETFADYYLLSPELPNMGSRMGEKLTSETAIEAIKNLILEKVGEKKAIIFGYSMGGHLAMKFGHAHPELCTALILGGCANEYYGVGANLFFSMADAVYKASPASVSCTFVHKVLPKHMSKKDVEFLMRTSMYYKAWADCGSIMKEPYQGFYRKMLSTFDKPILMIHGEKDFRRGEEAFVKSAKTGELVVIKGADHMILMDPKYNKVLSDKLKEFADKVTHGSQ